MLEKEAKAAFSTHRHCSQSRKGTILCRVATFFSLQTCTLGVLPMEILSVPEEKGPAQPPGSVVSYRGGILSLLINFSDPSEDYIPASRPAEKSKISHDTKRGKTFPNTRVYHAIYSLTPNNFKKSLVQN